MPVEVRHSVTEVDLLLDPVGLADEHTVVEKERVPVPQAEREIDPVIDTDGLLVRLRALLPVPLCEGLRLPELVPELEDERELVVVGVGELEGLTPTVRLGVEELVTVCEVVGVTVDAAVRLGVFVRVGVRELVLVVVPLLEGVSVLEAVLEGVVVEERLDVKVGVIVEVGVREGVDVELGDTVGELLLLPPGVSVDVGVAESLPVTVVDGVTEVVGEKVGVKLGVADAVVLAVAVVEKVELLLLVGLPLWVGEGLAVRVAEELGTTTSGHCTINGAKLPF